MRVESGSGFLYAAQRAQAPAVERMPTATSASTSFSEVLAATQSDTSNQADFTRMSRQNMRDLVNSKIRSGEMSLDEGLPFMAMTMKIPVNGGLEGEVSASSDNTQYDFTQKVRDGIQGALSRNDETTLKMLESAMQIMQKYQGQTIGIDVRA